MSVQFPLQFEFQSNLTFASFFPGNNVEIVNQLMSMAGEGSEQQIYIWGEKGSGKSHLVQACCQQAKAEGKDPFFLTFVAHDRPSPKILEGLEDIELVCFDDLQNIAGDADWERALFVFYNSHRQNNHKLLVAADCPPKYLPCTLPDLKTRMAWGLTLKIQALQNEQIIEALSFKARHLGFDIPPKVGQFLVNHYVHDLPSLWRLVEKIDKATLAAQRKLTIPFLKKILAETT